MTMDLGRLGKDHRPSKLEAQLTYLRNAIAELQERYMQLQIAIIGQQAQVHALLKHLGVTDEQLKAANELLKAEREKEKAEAEAAATPEGAPSEETKATVGKLAEEAAELLPDDED